MSLLLLEYTFSSATVGAPTSNQVRFDAGYPYSAVARVSVRNLTNDGADMRRVWLAVPIGSRVVVQDKNDSAGYGEFETTGAPVDQATYVDLPVVHVGHGTSLLNNQAVSVFVITPDAVVTPAPGAGGLLVTFEDAKLHLKITDSDHDAEVQTKLTHACGVVREYLKDRNDPTWDAVTAPAAVQVAALLLLAKLYQNRGDVQPDERVGADELEEWQRRLVRYRDPALA